MHDRNMHILNSIYKRHASAMLTDTHTYMYMYACVRRYGHCILKRRIHLCVAKCTQAHTQTTIYWSPFVCNHIHTCIHTHMTGNTRVPYTRALPSLSHKPLMSLKKTAVYFTHKYKYMHMYITGGTNALYTQHHPSS
jgi:hypothetical protein